MTAIKIIEKNINNFKKMFTSKTQLARLTKHNLLGQITFAVEMKALNVEQADKLIDIVFITYEELAP